MEIIDRQNNQHKTIMEITAKTIEVLPIESGTSKSGNDWQKRNFVVETADKYPKKLCFQLFGDKVTECPAVSEVVKVSFDIDSHEYNGRWFTQLNAWKVERVVAPQPQQPQAPAQQDWQTMYQQSRQQAQPTPPPAQGDDLPF